MKLLILGNSGSGKTTLSRQIAAVTGARVLSMDEVAFIGGTERRPLADSTGRLLRFLKAPGGGVIEGCYGDLAAAIAPQLDLLVFLHPGQDVCLRHCEQRPWEPDKFESPEAQEVMREGLLDWVGRYETRDDEYGYRSHQRVFDRFVGQKIALAQPDSYLDSTLNLLEASRCR